MKNTQKQKLDFLAVNLQLFADPNNYLNTTGSSDLSVEMKTYYSDFLIDNAEPKLVHAQFGQKHPIPKGSGKTIEFRKCNPYPKALTPLQEGVTPAGRSFSVTNLTATVKQYGDYSVATDIAELTMVDPLLSLMTQEHGRQAGRTLDTITRDIISAGQNVQYANDRVSARYLLSGGEDNYEDNCYLSVDAVRRAVRALKNQNAEPIGNSYVGIVHPDAAYDLMNDPKWESVKDYDPGDWYEGEIGRIAGVRFVETTEAKIFHAEDLSAANRNLSFSTTGYAAGTAAETELTIAETLTSADQAALFDRKVIIDGVLYTVKAVTGASKIKLAEAVAGVKLTSSAYVLTINNSSGYGIGSTAEMTIDETPVAAAIGARVYDAAGNIYTIKSVAATKVTLNEPLAAALADNAVLTSCGIAPGTTIYPGEAGWDGRDVYSTLIIGDNAYGVTELTGGGLQHIFKPLGSAGAADPLNQRATTGWKATQTACILVDAFMRRIETACTFQSGAN